MSCVGYTSRSSGACPNSVVGACRTARRRGEDAARHVHRRELRDVPRQKAASPTEIDARHAELAHLVEVVLPGLAQAEELLHNCNNWIEAIEDGMQRGESALSRQILAKALAGAPIYIMPMPERGTWAFLGLASYEGVIRGGVRPGAVATFARTTRTRPR